MEDKYFSKIDELKIKLNINFLEAIVQKLDNDKINYYNDEIINRLESSKHLLNKSEPNIGSVNNTTNCESDNIFESMDKYVFNRSWNKLPEVHKLIKIKEYINTKLLIYGEEKKDLLIKDMFDAIKDKKLTKKGTVNYDVIKGSIISIPTLKYNKNDETYYLENK